MCKNDLAIFNPLMQYAYQFIIMLFLAHINKQLYYLKNLINRFEKN